MAGIYVLKSKRASRNGDGYEYEVLRLTFVFLLLGALISAKSDLFPIILQVSEAIYYKL